MLDVGDVEGDVAELKRNDAFGLEFLRRESVALEHFDHRAFGIGEHQHVGDRRFGIFAALGLDAVARHLLFEIAEIGVGRDLKSDAHALRLRAVAQHHRVMVDGRGEKDGVLLLGGERQSQNLGVILALPVEIGRLVAGMGDLADADHTNSPAVMLFWRAAASR